MTSLPRPTVAGDATAHGCASGWVESLVPAEITELEFKWQFLIFVPNLSRQMIAFKM